jgi:hypothetical protein
LLNIFKQKKLKKMKKIILSIVVLAALSVGISSCSSCQTCSYSGLASIEYCSKDFPSKASFNTSMDALNAAGWNCK